MTDINNLIYFSSEFKDKLATSPMHNKIFTRVLEILDGHDNEARTVLLVNFIEQLTDLTKEQSELISLYQEKITLQK